MCIRLGKNKENAATFSATVEAKVSQGRVYCLYWHELLWETYDSIQCRQTFTKVWQVI